ncbi:MAG TPA: sigma-70 family RNA polymerase sigma factor [Solirubrobacterales bacterium]|jgi:RNA polymerase sigma factor (sigma-70 family)|nr:sigma-70 family RNA polymerase sigma factor [Solirubrobacterales bacterium]
MSQERQAAAMRGARLEREGSGRAQSDAARKRAAIEMIAAHEAALRRTARRYSLDAEDAEDAYQRALEIAITKAPTTDARELIRWTQTVTKHEALALRQSRERLLGHGGRPTDADGNADPVALLPAAGDGPEQQVERREAIARSREALQALKPAELRALSLLAEGYSYVEIGELTGFSQTKINRVLAEGRERFRSLVSSSEDGSRCRQLRPLLSSFCDGEANSRDSETVREHLRACGHCRSTVRAYRAAPRIAVALAPALAPSRSLLERVQELLGSLHSRLPGIGAASDSAAVQIAAGGGSRGTGMVALAKLFALCAGAAGGAAACVATGVLPAPDLSSQQMRKPTIERSSLQRIEAEAGEAVQYEAAPSPVPAPDPEPKPKPLPEEEPAASNEDAAAVAAPVEYEPPPPPPAPEAAAPSGGESGSAAGEFGP